jgi:NAD(P)-dependent dehydrogenase (short-subunit alcohol dehydrogenase family)
MVNAAGVAPEIKNPQPIWAMPDDNWTATMGVNATGVMNCCRAATAQMMRQDPLPNGDRGWVVNLSSIYGQTAAPGNGTHCNLCQTPPGSSSTADRFQYSGILRIEARSVGFDQSRRFGLCSPPHTGERYLSWM